MNPIAYRVEMERVAPDEQETFDQLSTVFRQIQEHVLHKAGEAKHGTHAKSTALLKGTLVVPDDLPAELAQGLFAKGGRYDALVRCSQGPSEELSTRHRASGGYRSRCSACTGRTSGAVARRPRRIGCCR